MPGRSCADKEAVQCQGHTRIKIQPLTDEAFRPFGEVLSRKESEPFFQMTDGRVQGWKVDFSCVGPTEVAYMKVDFQSWAVEDMERHFQVTQSFIPLKGKPMIMVVARATDPDDREAVPPPQEYSAFYMDGSQGVMLGVGTWHASARLALYPARLRVRLPLLQQHDPGPEARSGGGRGARGSARW